MQPISITPGEPAGIGPELVVALAQRVRQIPWVVFADADMLSRRARLLGMSLRIDDRLQSPTLEAGCLTVSHQALTEPSTPGCLNLANAPYVLQTLERAIAGCLSGDFGALVTGPVQKSLMNEAGIAFSGHTEWLRDRSGAADVLMLLVAGTLRVGLVTTHIPLSQVAGAIDRPVLRRRLELLLTGLRTRFGVAEPTVLVAGLNPHAGEGGHLGDEEIRTIEPVCEEFRRAGERVVGPLPADTLFTPARLAGAHGVLAMYHDQGLPVLKHVGFGSAVNVTLGLPFVRTSVDHGTALDIAGKGTADSGSFECALDLAARLG